MLVNQLFLQLALIRLALIMSLIFLKYENYICKLKSSTAFSKPLPLQNFDQSGNFLAQNDSLSVLQTVPQSDFFHCRLLQLNRKLVQPQMFLLLISLTSFLEKQIHKQLHKMKNEVSYRNICQNLLKLVSKDAEFFFLQDGYQFYYQNRKLSTLNKSKTNHVCNNCFAAIYVFHYFH